MSDHADEVKMLVDAIGPILHGHDPSIVSAALADLTATLLVGFQGRGKEKVRGELFERHIELVMDLVPINEAELLERIRKEAH